MIYLSCERALLLATSSTTSTIHFCALYATAMNNCLRSGRFGLFVLLGFLVGSLVDRYHECAIRLPLTSSPRCPSAEQEEGHARVSCAPCPSRKQEEGHPLTPCPPCPSPEQEGFLGYYNQVAAISGLNCSVDIRRDTTLYSQTQLDAILRCVDMHAYAQNDVTEATYEFCNKTIHDMTFLGSSGHCRIILRSCSKSNVIHRSHHTVAGVN